jgi:hypothetical protein
MCGNNPINFTDPTGMIAALGFASSTRYPSTAAANVSVQAPASAPKLDESTISMPKSEIGNATVVAECGRPLTGDPGSYYVHPLTGDGRRYGDDGKAVLDFDISHSHKRTIPHINIWRDGKRDDGESLFFN